MLSALCVIIVPCFYTNSLQERREQWRIAEEERISSLPDPSIPHGHTMMPDKERRNTLRVLEESK